MIKKFNEYASEEVDRNEWPSAPKMRLSSTDREKIEMIRNIYIEFDSGKMSSDDAFSRIGDILGIDKSFPGPTKM